MDIKAIRNRSTMSSEVFGRIPDVEMLEHLDAKNFIEEVHRRMAIKLADIFVEELTPAILKTLNEMKERAR